MWEDNYKKILIESVGEILKYRDTLFNNVINLSMQGDLKEWNDSVEIGEIYQFDYELFRASDDVNIQLLIQLVKDIESTCESLVNINNLKIENNE